MKNLTNWLIVYKIGLNIKKTSNPKTCEQETRTSNKN